jgi:hypothetical protein
MIRKFKSVNGTYSWSDIKKNHSRLRYWVIFPQGIDRVIRGHEAFMTSIPVKTLKKALKVAKKYDAPIIEQIISCRLGKWCIKEFITPPYFHLTTDQIWDLYKEKPSIKWRG